MPEKVYSFKCGECGKQLAKFSDREAFVKSGIQIMCRNHERDEKKVNFAVQRIVVGSVNYALGKIVEFVRRPYAREKVQNNNTAAQYAKV